MNMYVAKKYVFMFLGSIIPVILFLMFLISGLGLVVSMMLVFVVAVGILLTINKFLYHPLTALIEGKGMLTMTLDSTGFIDTFLVSAEHQPFVRGLYKGKMKETMFDREITQYLVPPQKGRLVEATMLGENGKVVGKRKVLLMPTQQEKADYLFAFGHYPTFIYNKVLDTFLQKSALSDFEQKTFVRHAVMYLLKKTEELSSSVRDFARYIVEQIKPQKSWFEGKKWLIYVIIIVAVFIFIILFAPSIAQVFSGARGTLPGGGGPVIP
jgi:hypothetical protein